MVAENSSLYFCLTLTLFQSIFQTRTHTHTHTNALSLSISLSVTLTYPNPTTSGIITVWQHQSTHTSPRPSVVTRISLSIDCSPQQLEWYVAFIKNYVLSRTFTNCTQAHSRMFYKQATEDSSLTYLMRLHNCSNSPHNSSLQFRYFL